ncbi:MAG: hypothetical protein IPM92_14905 [Saprospiraceae bacterium]|nr:hypothetical protein [Saprospiraceae bacterium]
MESGNIQIGDYQFEKYIEKERIESKIIELADSINAYYSSQNVQTIVLLDGAETFASKLIPHLKFPISKTELQLKTYEGFESTQTLQIPLELHHQFNKKDPVLIIEDIIDSGLTLFKLFNYLNQYGFNSLQIVTLLHKPTCLKYPIQPMFVGFEIGPEFVIGFGMDIDESGRELDCIYRLKSI